MKTTHKFSGTAARPGEDMVLFSIGGYRLAIAAHAVDEIQSSEGLSRFIASGLPKFERVRFTLARVMNAVVRSYFVVDGGTYFGQLPVIGDRMLIFRHASCALLVDSIQRMAQVANIVPLPRAFSGDERRWYHGLAIVDGEVVPVLDAEAVLTSAEVEMLQNNLAKSAATGATA